MTNDRKILVGVISGAHGVQGDVRLRSFTDVPEAIKKYKPLTDEAGNREFKFKFKSATNNYFIAALEGIKDRDAAEALRNTKLYILRSALPKTAKREFYESDLVGLAAVDGKDKNCGNVIAVHNYGGGPFLEIQPPEGGAFMLPFDKKCVPAVDIPEGRIVINPPDGWIETARSQTTKPAREEKE